MRDKIESTSTLSPVQIDGTDISQMTENTTLHSIVLTIEKKKKRRRQGILFSSRKQLQRARMGRRKTNIMKVDISVVAKVLSYNSAECGSDGALLDILENDRDSIVSNHLVISR